MRSSTATFLNAIAILLSVSNVHAFTHSTTTTTHSNHATTTTGVAFRTRTMNTAPVVHPNNSKRNTELSMGFFDDIAYMFSEEGRKARAEYEAKEKAEQEAAYREIFERRRSEEKMADYEAEVAARRNMYAQERQEWENQNKVEVEGRLED